MTEKRGHISDAQKKTLINIMEQEEFLRKGKFSSSFTFKDAQRKWEDVAKQLNSIPGSQKNWKDWRRTWQDMKKNVKKKNSFMKKCSEQTGGGPPSNITFSEDDENLLKIMDPTSIEGDSHVNESIVHIDAYDHSYHIVENMDYENTPTCSTNVGTPDEKEIVIEKENITHHAPKRKCTTTKRRLEESCKAQEKFSVHLEKKIKIKEEYYQKKISIMKEDIEVKKRIASALENLLVRKESELDA